MKTITEFDAEELNLITLAQEYSDESKARALLESLRWPNGAFCPHCGCKQVYKIVSRQQTAVVSGQRKQRQGLYSCSDCRKQFTVTVGTVFEASHISIAKWMMAVFLLCSSKKGISSHQLHRMLKLTYKTAWFMSHRIHYAMKEGPLAGLLGGVVEIDETFVGGKPRFGDQKVAHKGGYRKDSNKTPVVALIQRNGNVRTTVVPSVNANNLRDFVNSNIAKGSIVNTDSSSTYNSILWPIIKVGKGRHDMVNHNNRICPPQPGRQYGSRKFVRILFQPD